MHAQGAIELRNATPIRDIMKAVDLQVLPQCLRLIDAFVALRKILRQLLRGHLDPARYFSRTEKFSTLEDDDDGRKRAE